MNCINYNIKASYIDTKNGKRRFQEEMEKFIKDREHSIMVLKAPTGSGKTYGFYNLNEKNNVLMVMPNNVLVEQVYNDLIKQNKNCKKLTADDLDSIENDKNIDRRRAFNLLINPDENSFVITNPEILLRLVINKYTTSDKIDEIALLKENGFNLIIIDEFHVYNTQQLKELSAIIYILNKSFKILLASATPNYAIIKPLESILKNKIIKYDVKRQDSGSDVIQGPINLKICLNMDIKDFINLNKDIIMNGRWLFILDKIISIEDVYNELLKCKISPDDISLFDSYHNDKNWNRRIILSSNILEQGINIPEIENVVIEPGRSAVNIEQRLGRVGRGRRDESNAYIILNNISENNFNCDIKDYDSLMDKFYSIFENNDSEFGSYSLGVQIAKISESFTYLMRHQIYMEFIKDYDEIKHGYLDFVQINNVIKNKKIFNNHRANITMEKWWNKYKETMETFINADKKIKIRDQTIYGKDFETEYSQIWLARFKEVTGNIARGTRIKPQKICLKVLGMPFSSDGFFIPYSELYNARKKIIELADTEIKQHEYDFINNDIARKLKYIIYSTADPGRLTIMDVTDC
ncbi:type I-D CRISPR-associated helicase Cas3' [Picrophilus oshimae]|uniref:DEAD/DEAH box helicase n=1 Tax=Picrophilus torridus (strain ATCC 700027 / DSM 9790 / JCM 10055 / NBRC 100828 / KAW 2/3) TaxID=1122961 RepID=Q6L361_PICTO|nr:type I-D CRISPR-associated helicase Cas3' [Picrophilus oshimae]AAT42590.1 DEAD/DEAH box helicase [Picrophilus oshimae DSM 9789]